MGKRGWRQTRRMKGAIEREMRRGKRERDEEKGMRRREV
jgi:hypothetical protein